SRESLSSHHHSADQQQQQRHRSVGVITHHQSTPNLQSMAKQLQNELLSPPALPSPPCTAPPIPTASAHGADERRRLNRENSIIGGKQTRRQSTTAHHRRQGSNNVCPLRPVSPWWYTADPAARPHAPGLGYCERGGEPGVGVPADPAQDQLAVED